MCIGSYCSDVAQGSGTGMALNAFARKLKASEMFPGDEVQTHVISRSPNLASADQLFLSNYNVSLSDSNIRGLEMGLANLDL